MHSVTTYVFYSKNINLVNSYTYKNIMFRANDVEQSENKRFHYNQTIIKGVTHINYSFEIKSNPFYLLVNVKEF